MSSQALPPPSDPSLDALPAGGEQPPGERPRADSFWSSETPRLKVFLSVFLLTLAIGLSAIFLRTPAYEARATVELRPSDDPANADGPVDFQFLLTQVQNITSRSILEQVVQRIGDGIGGEQGRQALNRLEDALAVEPVQGTALVHVIGRGEDPGYLVLVVNSLVDIYGQSLRERRLERSNDSTFALRRQVLTLQRSITEKRRELELFQQEYDITSQEREENEVLTRVKSLAQDRDRLVAQARKAEARLAEVESAVGTGEAILRPQDEKSLAALGARIARLEALLAARSKNWTARHMALDPEMREARENLSINRSRYKQMFTDAQRDALVRARQDLGGASRELTRVEAELELQKAAAQQFTSRFQQFKGLNTELDELRKRHQQLRNQLTRLDLNRAAEIPRMEVIEEAKPPTRAASSKTLQHAGMVLAGALLLALFAVWLAEFLTRSRAAGTPPPAQVSVSVTGPAPAPAVPFAERAVLGAQPSSPERLAQASQARLEGAGERVLEVGELEDLWHGAGSEARPAIGLLFNGAGPGELLQLVAADLDLQRSELGIGDRIVPLSPALQAVFSESPPTAPDRPLAGEAIVSASDLDALVACAAVDGGLDTPTAVDAEMVQRSYLVYLVQQGVRLAELKRVAGPLPPATLSSFASWSPAGAGIALEDAAPFLPFLVTAAP